MATTSQSLSPKAKILTDDIEPLPILDFEKYSNTIVQLIKDSDPRFSIGIYGEWGSGKTTLMKSIENKVTGDKDIMTVWFNAWRFEREDQFAIVSLMKTIAYKMSGHPRYKKIKPLFWKGVATVGKGLATKYILPEKNVEEFYKDVLSEAKVLAEADRDTIYFEGIKKIEDAMTKINEERPNSRIVVFIDDLDRCSPTRTLEVFESIKVFLDIKGFIYVIGLSYETISKLISAAYKESGISGEQYIRKLIQIPVIIPEWNDEDIYKLIDNLSSKVGSSYSDIIRNNKEVIARGIELNPREVKRFINNFIVANEIYSKEKNIKPKELLVVQALRVRWINFYRFLSSKEDFRKIVQEYIGKQQQERERTFNYHKGYIAKEYEQLLSEFIQKPELWQLWDFLDKEKETILNIRHWEVYRRAAGVDVSMHDWSAFLAASKKTLEALKQWNIQELLALDAGSLGSLVTAATKVKDKV